MNVSNNPLLIGARGALGRTVVCKQVRGKTVMANMPKKPDPSKETEAQRQTRHTFKNAAAYAKASMGDAALKAYYVRKAHQLKLPNAYTAALTDYLRQGKIEAVNRRKYTGKVGGEIMVIVRKKDFSVRQVEVCLSTTDGTFIEKGPAIQNKNGNWIYRNTVAVPEPGAVVLQVRGIDVNGMAFA